MLSVLLSTLRCRVCELSARLIDSLMLKFCIPKSDEGRRSCRSDLQNVPFGTLKRVVLRCKTARFATPSANGLLSTNY